jgi:hypothetical protein
VVFELGRCEHTCKCDQAWASSTLKPRLHCIIQCTPGMQRSWSQYLNLHCIVAEGFVLRHMTPHHRLPSVDSTSCAIRINTAGCLKVRCKQGHQPNTELVGFLTNPLDIPAIRILFLNSLSLCLSVRLWFILRVFGNSGKQFRVLCRSIDYRS